MNSIAGVWTLTSLKHTLTSGKTIYPMGRRPEGILILTKDGFMSVHLADGDRERFKKAGLFQGSLKERAGAYDSYVAYCGDYRVEGKRLFVEAKLSLFPNWKGTTQIRSFRLGKSTLSLWTRSFVFNGEEQVAHLEWKRR
ncbi:MAG: lipocalin-like domain-containing protein [Deltaproteobacteria bacterium]|nr:lipocalin-like domain-containing protein [Deltaproteobacteria bacterium]MBI3294371.1 lipocalin-like domain-containing protein [Deltaproteobacteria bacterium]